METVVKTTALKKNYGDEIAVDSIDLEIFKGEIFGIVGPDGAGKTTTLRMLSTALVPDSGRAAIMGLDVVAQTDKVKQRIGYMPQQFSLYGDLTVEENIDFFSDLYQVPERAAKQRKRELLLANNLEDFLSRPADKLSGGMKKKLALSCTLIHTPDVIILDEPTTGVDPLSRREFWKILNSLVPSVTVIVSTPYMDEAERCGRIALMHKGKLVHVDTPKEIIKKFQGEVLEIKCDCLRKGRDLFKGFPEVGDVQIFGDSLRLYVPFADEAKPKIEAHLRNEGFTVSSINAVPPRLEDVFISLLK